MATASTHTLAALLVEAETSTINAFEALHGRLERVPPGDDATGSLTTLLHDLAAASGDASAILLEVAARYQTAATDGVLGRH